MALRAHCSIGLCGLMHAISLEKRMRQLLGALPTAQAPGRSLTQHCSLEKRTVPTLTGSLGIEPTLRLTEAHSETKPCHRGCVRAQASDSGFGVPSILLHSKCPHAQGHSAQYHPVPSRELPSHKLCFWQNLPWTYAQFRTN